MNPFLSMFLKICLVVAVACLGLLLIFGLAIGLGFPWWVGIFIILGIFGCVIGIVFLKKVLLKRREDSFVHQIIQQDESRMSGLGTHEKDKTKDLAKRWKEAIEVLRNSHLKKYGNPLYVLPWYLVIGESGSGKTTAIKSARLSSPFADFSHASGISGTKNCDWWFFEQAIIIDTAGRYAIPVDNGRDKNEWEDFLSLLLKYRKKEPINGLVVTIAANKLLSAKPEALAEDSRKIRKRIDELMGILGAKFPIYVLVTKCDLVQGMTQFCDGLPENAVDQAMGLLKHERKSAAHGFVDQVFHSLGQRLRSFRLIFLERSHAGNKQDPNLLMFPDEFEQLRPGLRAFIQETFLENPYQEAPVLRGIFFSSGRQEGSPYSHFLSELGLIQETEVLPGTSKGLFLHDFFAKILPRDRKLYAPTQRALAWGRLTRNLGLSAWVALILALSGLLSYSFVKNLSILHEVSRDFSKPPVLSGNLPTDVMIMDHFRQAIVKVETRNQDWWIPRFELKESKNIEERLSKSFALQFKKDFLVSFDKEMAEQMTGFSSMTPEQTLASHAAHLTRRINLLRARIQGEGLENLKAMPQPAYNLIRTESGKKVIPEIIQRLKDQYLYYLAWEEDTSALNKEMISLQNWLKHVVTLKGSNMNWLATWADMDSHSKGLTLESFWGGSRPVLNKSRILPAFTISGKNRIELFLSEMEKALPNPLAVAAGKIEFQKWYNEKYLQTWHDFAVNFPMGRNTLRGEEEWLQVVSRIAGRKGPFEDFMEKMAAELDTYKENQENPDWVKFVFDFQSIKDRAAELASVEKTGKFAKIAGKGISFVSKLKDKKSGKKPSEIAMAESLKKYDKANTEIAASAASRRAAFQMAVKAFSEDPETGKSPFFTAWKAAGKLKAAWPGAELSKTSLWGLVTGPFDFLGDFVRTQASCLLQEAWEKDVLVEVEGVASQSDMNRLLFGPEGYADKFVKGKAAPFISRSLRKGYYAKKVMGYGLPLEKNFLNYLTRGAKTIKPAKASYPVSIMGLPTDTNSGARVRPHATRLEVQCAEKVFKIANLNFPIRKTIQWSPENCGDVVFQIDVSSLVLTKPYSGYMAFARFIRDFSKGRHIFHPRDFPGQRSALRRLGIKYIKVKYRFKGERAVLKLLANSSPGKLPQKVAECWAH